MSLLNDVSIAVTPNGYKAEKLYAVIPSSGAADMDVTRATDATRVNERGLIEPVLSNVPRIDYTGGGCPHILAEPQRTNLLPYSEDFSQSNWVKNNAGTGLLPVVTSNFTTAPDGTATASKIVFDAGTGTTSGDSSQILDAITFTNNTVGTSSIYLKGENGGEKLIFRGVADSTYTLLTLTTEWQRFSTTENSGTNTDAITFGIRQNVSGLGVINSSATVYAWGAQIEVGSYPTSYIPTSGSTVTRNQDEFTRNNLANLINSAEGVLFVEAKTTYDSSESRRITLSDGTINNRVSLEFDESAQNKIKAFISLNGTTEILEYNAPDLSIYNKIAIKYKLNDFSIWFNGTEVDADSAGNIPVGLTQLVFDGGNGANFFYGEVKQLQVYKTALTDNQLMQLTSESYESYSAMAAALTYTIQ